MSWMAELTVNYHNWKHSIFQNTKLPFLQRKENFLSSSENDSDVGKSEDSTFRPLRIGVLSAAAINYCAIIDPCATHPRAIITAIAARSYSKAAAQIKKYRAELPGVEQGLPRAYGSYEALLNDASDIVDAIYIPLPNGLHAKWALAAIEKGYHVLVEKPFCNNAAEARMIREAAQKKGVVALEAFHWLFHPAPHLVRSSLESGNFGKVLRVDAQCLFVKGIFAEDDIRFQYPLGAGCIMDLTYLICAVAYYGAADMTDNATQFEVVEAKARTNVKDPLVDEAMEAKLRLKTSASRDSHWASVVEASICGDEAVPPLWGIIPQFWKMHPDVTIQCEKAEIVFGGFMGPWFTHRILVTELTRDSAGNILQRGNTTKTTCFKGGHLWDREKDTTGEAVGNHLWTTYRYQLEAFASKVREVEATKANDPNGYVYRGPWVSLDFSIKVMEMIDKIYEKAGLPLRGA